MFNLTLLDHLRLTFGHVVSRHRAHSHIAHTRAQASRRLRAVEALLLAIVAFTAIGTAFGQARGYAIAAAVSAGVAMVVFVEETWPAATEGLAKGSRIPPLLVVTVSEP